MPESFKLKRVSFEKGFQRKFLKEVQVRYTQAEIATMCKCSERTIRDWKREKFSIPLLAVQLLCKKTRIPFPKDVTTHDQYAHTSRAGKLGYASAIRLYGALPKDEVARKDAWGKWWGETGIKNKNPILVERTIKKPKKNVLLAECIGFLMGDGGISTYQVTVTLHHTEEKEYGIFVANRLYSLFGTKPKIYHRPEQSVNDISISRIQLVKYLHALGLPIGNKVRQDFDIPEWIKNNRSFSIACIRGLIDTDGCVFTHSYRVGGKLYHYKKLIFTSASSPLISTVYKIFSDLQLHPRRTRDGKEIRLDRIVDVKSYFKLVGTHNPKHLRRYRS